jgi:hypothetical protein
MSHRCWPPPHNSRVRYAVVPAVVAVALAGCGGSSGSARNNSRAVAAIVASEVNALPASAHGPMLCTVYEPGLATQVIFTSDTLDVRAECRAWTHDRSTVGYLWGYQPARAASDPVGSRQFCYLTDRARHVAARIVEVTGLRIVSPAQSARAASECRTLLASGWIRRPRRRAAITGN